MAVLGKIIKRGMKLREALVPKSSNYKKMQRRVLLKLLFKARNTAFGKQYSFVNILENGLLSANKSLMADYQKNVPIHDYNSIFKAWWYRSLNGEPNITWPGKIKYFALSSGTSEAATKHIPVSKQMIKAIHRTSIRQMMSLPAFHKVSSTTLEKGYLMIGGSIELNYKEKGYYEGDLSGITAGKIPMWFERFYKPGKKIAAEKNWERKLDKIVKKAKDWDIGFVAGVPAWVQILLERIIKEYNLKHIHQIWPNLGAFAHGGVSFEPYRQSFAKLLGRPIDYIETYLASEGFLACQYAPEQDMRLVLNNGIFFEFVPFNEQNFDDDGQILPAAKALTINNIEENTEYALLISTVSGAWRYLIGDTIKFTDKKTASIKITGRTKHFLSLCGEHLSVDNMNKALELTAQKYQIAMPEYTVIGGNNGHTFYHHWYIGAQSLEVDSQLLTHLDEALKALNDDYIIERQHALGQLKLTVLPQQVFYDFLSQKGKSGGQHKFPRVMKKADQISDWQAFVVNSPHKVYMEL
jgi:hypothetical protein